MRTGYYHTPLSELGRLIRVARLLSTALGREEGAAKLTCKERARLARLQRFERRIALSDGGGKCCYTRLRHI